MKVLKSFYRMGVVFALTVMHPTFSAGAEITCVEFYSGQNDPARLAQLYPSGRKPGPDTCRTRGDHVGRPHEVCSACSEESSVFG